jgi:ABC-type glycerol-3-phosphate transport system substrate-binding protein
MGIEPETLRGIGLQLWHPWLGVEASLLDSQVAEFNQSNEWGITVRGAGQSGYTELYNNVTAALPGSDRPHLAVALPEHAVGWDEAGYVVDLVDYVDDPLYGLARDQVTDFPAVFWAQDSLAGRRLGVPAQRSARFLLYNQSWAHQLGHRRPPQSPDEFREQACDAHQSMGADDDPTNDGQGGWLVDPDSRTFLSWLTAFGGGVLDGNGFRFLTPKNLEALVFIKALHDDGCAWLAPSEDDAATAFAARRALLTSAGLEDLPEYSRAMAAAENADTWTVMSFPGPEQSALAGYGSSFVILQSSPEQQLASWLFIRWMLSPDNQVRWVEATGLFPLRASMMELLEEYARSHPQWSDAVEFASEAQIEPQSASWRQVRVMLSDGFEAMFRSNTAAGRVAEVLALMDRTSRDLSE